jgi:hypothetical protein
LSNLIGVRNGTGGSAAIGWGGGLIVALTAIPVVSRLGNRGMIKTPTPFASATPQPAQDQDSDYEETPMMEFDTAGLEQAYNEVLLWVTQLFGESAWVNDERPQFSLPVGQNGICIGLQSYGDDGACVDFFAWPVRDTPLPDDAYDWALRTNAQYRFGALNIQPNGELLVEHVALFEGMTKSTFSELTQMLASTCDEISLEFGSRFLGGNLVE